MKLTMGWAEGNPCPLTITLSMPNCSAAAFSVMKNARSKSTSSSRPCSVMRMIKLPLIRKPMLSLGNEYL